MLTFKRIFTFLLTAMLVGPLTGCGETVPDLTTEQETAISEYAVELVTKYSKEGNHRLQLQDEALEDTFFEEGYFQEMQEDAEGDAEMISEDVDESNDSSDASVETTEPIGNSDETKTEEPVYSERSLDQIFGTSNVAISYNGYEVTDTYAPDTNSYFSLSATRGKKFVVLYFNITNLTDQVVNVDLNALDVKYTFGDAKGKKKKLEHTMTAKDLYSYVGTLEPGQADTLVGLVEMVESDIEKIEEPVLSVQYADTVDVLLLR